MGGGAGDAEAAAAGDEAAAAAEAALACFSSFAAAAADALVTDLRFALSPLLIASAGFSFCTIQIKNAFTCLQLSSNCCP